MHAFPNSNKGIKNGVQMRMGGVWGAKNSSTQLLIIQACPEATLDNGGSIGNSRQMIDASSDQNKIEDKYALLTWKYNRMHWDNFTLVFLALITLGWLARQMWFPWWGRPVEPAKEYFFLFFLDLKSHYIIIIIIIIIMMRYNNYLHFLNDRAQMLLILEKICD